MDALLQVGGLKGTYERKKNEDAFFFFLFFISASNSHIVTILIVTAITVLYCGVQWNKQAGVQLGELAVQKVYKADRINIAM